MVGRVCLLCTDRPAFFVVHQERQLAGENDMKYHERRFKSTENDPDMSGWVLHPGIKNINYRQMK